MILDLVVFITPLLAPGESAEAGCQILGLREIAGSGSATSAASRASSMLAYPLSTSHAASLFVTVPAARRRSLPAITFRTMK